MSAITVEEMYHQHIQPRPLAEQLQLLALISQQLMLQQTSAVGKLQAMRQQIKRVQGKIAEFCQRWQITELALMNTELNGSIEIMADFVPTTRWSLFDHLDMQDELQAILGNASYCA